MRKYQYPEAKKKYQMTDTTINHRGRRLHQIQALIDFGWVRAGDLGGFIETEKNLSHAGNCWVDVGAKVYDHAFVLTGAYVGEGAEVFDNASVGDIARVFGVSAAVYGRAQVFGDTIICGNARVYECARVFGQAVIEGYVHVFGNANIYGQAHLKGTMRVYGELEIDRAGFTETDMVKQLQDKCKDLSDALDALREEV